MIEIASLPDRSFARSPAEVEGLGYSPGMQTAVSIPDEVFAQAEKLARHAGVSRS